uniref:Uncharacterized protein LOC100375097 isoform X4 n=2 Tax=Saccoglossus kowalevskii TaxID=10224 RepID=A0ABM0MS93_SACKO|nr:PREDICTED: uncharacterized protein LOC100375097 isoform X4 [Saccoglossus kowalevskii]
MPGCPPRGYVLNLVVVNLQQCLFLIRSIQSNTMAFFDVISMVTLFSLGCLIHGTSGDFECIKCEYDESWASIFSDYDCVTNPGSMETATCSTTCYTWAYYSEDLFGQYDLKVERGCASLEQNSTWSANQCDEYDDVDSSESAYVCTCDYEDSCNADDSDYHQCYYCETKVNDYTCKNDLVNNHEPIACLTGHSGCGTRTVAYNTWLFTDDAERYCTDEETTDADGDCTTDNSGFETCLYYCSGNACNDIENIASRSTIPTTLIFT